MPSHSLPHPSAAEVAARLQNLEAQITAWRLNWEQSKADFQHLRGNPPPEESLLNALEAADLENARLRLELASAKHQLMQASHVPRKSAQTPAPAPTTTRSAEAITEVKSAPVDWDLNTGARVRTGFEKSIFGALRGVRG